MNSGAIKHSGCGYSGSVALRGKHIDSHCGYMRTNGGEKAGWIITVFMALLVVAVVFAHAFATAAV